MLRLLIISFFCITSIHSSFGQNQKTFDSLPPLKEIVGDNKNPLRDSTFLDSITKVYGERIVSIIIDSLLKNAAYNKFWTRDYEHIFSTSEITELDSIIAKFEKETTNEIVIVTIPSYTATKENFDSLILSIANQLGIGKKNVDNGILIGISVGLRKIRISNGYGIVQKLSDNDTKKIIDNIMLLEYKIGNYFIGTKQGLLTIIQKLR